MSKKLLAFLAAAVLVFSVSGCGNKTETASDNQTAGVSDNAQKSEDNNGAQEQGDVQETTQEKVTPTFMYFVSKNDAGHDDTMGMLEELKKEYDGKVNFDIVDIDENIEAAANFPVQGQTPALIMLNTTNDISAMEFQCSDKDTLKTDIENALK